MGASTEAPLKVRCNSLARKTPSFGQSYKICTWWCWNVLLPFLTQRFPECWWDHGICVPPVPSIPHQTWAHCVFSSLYLRTRTWVGSHLKVRLLKKDCIQDILTYEVGSTATARNLQRRLILSVRKTSSDPVLASLGTFELNKRLSTLLKVSRETCSAKLKKRGRKKTFSFHSIWSFNWLQKYWPTVVIKISHLCCS